MTTDQHNTLPKPSEPHSAVGRIGEQVVREAHTDSGEVLPPTLAEMIKPEHTAIIVVDMMEAYCDPEAPFPKSIEATTTGLDVTADRIDKFLGESRSFPIASTVFVRMLERPETVTPNIRAKMEFDGIPPVAEQDGVGWNYYKVQPQEGDHQIVKTHYNAFTGTDLHEHLQEYGIKTVIVLGGYGSTCVSATALFAADGYGYNVFVPKDLTADLDSPNTPENPAPLPGVLKAFELVFGFTPVSSAILNTWKQEESVVLESERLT